MENDLIKLYKQLNLGPNENDNVIDYKTKKFNFKTHMHTQLNIGLKAEILKAINGSKKRMSVFEREVFSYLEELITTMVYYKGTYNQTLNKEDTEHIDKFLTLYKTPLNGKSIKEKYDLLLQCMLLFMNNILINNFHGVKVIHGVLYSVDSNRLWKLYSNDIDLHGAKILQYGSIYIIIKKSWCSDACCGDDIDYSYKHYKYNIYVSVCPKFYIGGREIVNLYDFVMTKHLYNYFNRDLQYLYRLKYLYLSIINSENAAILDKHNKEEIDYYKNTYPNTNFYNKIINNSNDILFSFGPYSDTSYQVGLRSITFDDIYNCLRDRYNIDVLNKKLNLENLTLHTLLDKFLVN